MKKLITICILLVVTYTANAQVNFVDKNLAISEGIAFKTNYYNVKDFMKNNNYGFIEESENELDLPNNEFVETLILDFKGISGNEITITYSKKNQTFFSTSTFYDKKKAINVDAELKNESFRIGEENEDYKFWHKGSYKFQIINSNWNDTENRLALISKNHPEYVNDFEEKRLKINAQKVIKSNKLKEIKKIFEENLIETTLYQGYFIKNYIKKITISENGELLLKISTEKNGETKDEKIQVNKFEILKIQGKNDVEIKLVNYDYQVSYHFYPKNLELTFKTFEELKELIN